LPHLPRAQVPGNPGQDPGKCSKHLPDLAIWQSQELIFKTLSTGFFPQQEERDPGMNQKIILGHFKNDLRRFKKSPEMN
jgi:hypothetical protein